MGEIKLRKIINSIRRVVFFLLYYTGIGHLLMYLNRKNLLVPILLFHRVSDSYDPYWPPLSTQAFKKIIVFFSRKYTIRPVKDLFDHSPVTLKGSCFIVFDDAYKDFLQNALPFLKEKNIPVTMFVPVESIKYGKPIWTTWLNMCINQTKTLSIRSNEQVVYDTSNIRSKVETAHLLTDWLKSLPYEKFKHNLKSIIEQTGDNIERSDITVMNWNEIVETADDVDYQSHTMSHPMLGNINETNILDYEIGEAKQIIEQEIKRPVNYISYPIGSYSDAVLESSSKFYDAAFAVDGRLADLKELDDPCYKYKIPRFNVSDSDPYELFFRVNGVHKFFGR